MSTTIKTNAAFIKAFIKKFGGDHRKDFWIKEIDGTPTSGEGCFVNGLELFDYYNMDYAETTYRMMILIVVDDWLNSVGWFGEPQDAGTLKFYRA